MSAPNGHLDSEIDAALRGRRVLVTGAAGFIGARLVRALHERGAEVHGVSRAPQTGDHVRWHAADLAEPEVTSRLVQDVRPQLVYHLASHVSGDRAVGAVMPTLHDNLLTTVSLLTAACGAGGPRVVLAGSMEECAGDGDDVPGSPYAAAKTAAGAYGRMFHALYGLPVVNLRIYMVYGPGQRDGSKLIPYVTDCLLRGEHPRLSSGRREVDWVYVDDVVAALLAAAQTGPADGTAVDIGSGEVTTIRSIVDRLAGLVGGEGRPVYGALDDRPLERRRAADVRRTRQMLGWEPVTPLDAGLARTVEWFRARRAEAGAI